MEEIGYLIGPGSLALNKKERKNVQNQLNKIGKKKNESQEILLTFSGEQFILIYFYSFSIITLY